MIKPICVRCQRFYRPVKNGFPVIEGMPLGNDAPPGILAPERWVPYKLWVADKWRCEGCGHEIVVGSGANPVSEHYMDDFRKKVEEYQATFQVNDC